MAREMPSTMSEETCAVVVGREPRHLRCRSYTDSSMDSTQFKIAEEFFYRKGQAYPGNTQDLANTKQQNCLKNNKIGDLGILQDINKDSVVFARVNKHK